MTNKHTVVVLTHAVILGMGYSSEEAIADAKQWPDADENEELDNLTYHVPETDEPYLAVCTPRFAAFLRAGRSEADRWTTDDDDQIDLRKKDCHGEVEYEGKTLFLQQEVYALVCGDKYAAAAFDDDGNQYFVTWDITNPDATDECDACDWDDFEIEKR